MVMNPCSIRQSTNPLESGGMVWLGVCQAHRSVGDRAHIPQGRGGALGCDVAVGLVEMGAVVM